MRIIAGTCRGRTLIAPKGSDTRPTLDRVRESLFSILLPRLDGARVLDLFAGSGALGLESLSRGAASAVFVDHARQAQDCVQRNIDALGLSAQATLLRQSWRGALQALSVRGDTFDLVFLDPPYRMPQADEMLEALRQSGLLAPNALVVYEHAAAHPPRMDAWLQADQRRFGDTTITFLRQAGEKEAHA